MGCCGYKTNTGVCIEAARNIDVVHDTRTRLHIDTVA